MIFTNIIANHIKSHKMKSKTHKIILLNLVMEKENLAELCLPPLF